MSKRLQVIVRDDELAAFEQVATIQGLTLSEWVRQTLRRAQRDTACDDVERKLAAIERALSYRDGPPMPDIDQLLEEMERSRLREIEEGLLPDESWF
jgi:hypothetical protein